MGGYTIDTDPTVLQLPAWCLVGYRTQCRQSDSDIMHAGRERASRTSTAASEWLPGWSGPRLRVTTCPAFGRDLTGTQPAQVPPQLADERLCLA
jgi:hypothetical protein